MFGERYFATRKKLARVVGEVRGLADSTGLELNGFSPDSELLQGLKNPFLFVVCGEVNAGKSTLINGLFGSEMCEVNILPQTDRVMWYRYGHDEKNGEITPVLEERYRPIDFLHDFNIVDTPGTNSVIRGHQAITERFLPVADLVLFVFPVNNPWGAATWDFIAKFPKELSGRVAFVLQQKDLRDEDELVIIKQHMRDLARQKLGEEPRVYAVSGRLAVSSKRREPFDERGWRESGYPELESLISEVVTKSPGRRQVLRDVRDATLGALQAIEDQIENKTKVVGQHESFLRGLDREIDRLRDDYCEGGDGKFASLGDVFGEEGADAMEVLRRRVGWGRTLCSLFRRDESPAEMEKDLTKAVETAVQELAAADAELMETVCRTHWGQASPRIRERLGNEPLAFDGGEVDLDSARDRLVRSMARNARQTVIGLKLRGVLEIQLEARRAVLRRFVAMALVLVSLGGGLGAAGMDPWSWVVIGLAGMVGILGMWQAKRSGSELLKWFAASLDTSRRNFTKVMTPGYLDGVRRFFGDYAKLVDVVRRKVSKNKLELKPRQDEWNDLFVELKAIEQEL
jgi:small GTP-binding protein